MNGWSGTDHSYYGPRLEAEAAAETLMQLKGFNCWVVVVGGGDFMKVYALPRPHMWFLPIWGHLMKVGNGVLILVKGRLEMSTRRRRTEQDHSPRRCLQGPKEIPQDFDSDP